MAGMSVFLYRGEGASKPVMHSSHLYMHVQEALAKLRDQKHQQLLQHEQIKTGALPYGLPGHLSVGLKAHRTEIPLPD